MVDGPQGRRLSFDKNSGGKGLSLPCGRCIGCRLERARQWAVRIMHESKMHSDSVFLTLTLRDPLLACSKCGPVGSLCVCQVQKFLKRLRRAIEPTRIRFFLCGEYGEKRGRPHYHAVIFGYGFPDKVQLDTPGEFAEYESKLLSDTWGLGDARLGTLSFDSAVYVANYATKKVRGKGAKAHYDGRKPEFLIMSRRPGIAAGWLDKFQGDVFPSDEVVVRGQSTRPPRYYSKRALVLCWQSTADILSKRTAAAAKLESFTLRCGQTVMVAPSNNARRLEVRRSVAEAKLQLKSRRLESK